MIPSLESHALLDAVEKSGNRTLTHRAEVTILLDIAREHKLEQVFEDIVFFSKFLTNAQVILKREGMASEHTLKLSAEFQEKLEKTMTLLNMLIKESQEEVRTAFLSKFLSRTSESLVQFISLLHDLAMLKNYFLDQERAAKTQ